MMRRFKISFGGWVCIILVVLIGVTIWWSPKAKDVKTKSQEEMTSRKAALLCTTDMATQYHIHPELSIVINGKLQVIPSGIGIQPTCMTSIHTHSADGIIHVESPVAKDFLLSDFFAVWGKEFNQNQILDYKTEANTHITITVNGKEVDTYENTILRDKDKIVITYQ